MNVPTLAPWIPQLLAACIPLTYGWAALRVRRSDPFHPGIAASRLATILAVTAALGAALSPEATRNTDSSGLFATGAVSVIMLILVCALALVIVRYSETYLQGDPGQPRYVRALMATLATVTLLIISNNLLLISIAWLGTSIALHQLLTFYPDRPQALVAAHKKFLLSRLADLCLLGAIVLLGSAAGSLNIDSIAAWAQEQINLPVAARLATVLLVLAVSLRSAQLPFHGWLTQVMEAPTPVSALLHAGIVNIGGFLMIRLAPLMAHADEAQLMLVCIGTVTAVVASLIMTTRVSAKVSLAWSTCAQMGFMLAECGLGLWHLALLHVVAHSLYKAHAFLGSGTVVEQWQIRQIAPGARTPRWGHFARAAVIVFAMTAVAASFAGKAHANATVLPLSILFAIGLTPAVAGRLASWPRMGYTIFTTGCIVALYWTGHAIFAQFTTMPQPTLTPLPWALVLAGFALLLGLQIVLQTRPKSPLARFLQPRLFAGLYLDEAFTRLTFRIWPPRFPQTAGPGKTYSTTLKEALS